MLTRIFHALTDAEGFWREMFRYGVLAKRKTQQDWFLFRHEVTRECAMRREPPGGPVKKYVKEIFPDIDKAYALVQISRPNAYNLSWEEVVTVSQLIRML